MVQNNRYNNRPHTKRPNVERPVEAKKCDCKCGCEKECACNKCECGCGYGCSKSSCLVLINGILVLIGTLFIAGSVLRLSDTLEGKSFVREKPAKTVQASAANNAAFAKYIKENPQVIIDSVNAYYQAQQAKAQAPTPKVADGAMVAEIIKDKTNHVLGNKKGSFVMIEFFDYNCGYCKMMNKKMAEAIKKSNNIRWILMDTPIFGEKSEIIARYAFAAAKQGKFAEYHAALGDAQDKSEAGLKKIGQDLGLDVEKLAKDAASDEAKAKLQANRKYAEKLNLSGVPMFIIDGQIQGGAFSDEQMEGYIKKANEMKAAKKAAKKAKK